MIFSLKTSKPVFKEEVDFVLPQHLLSPMKMCRLKMDDYNVERFDVKFNGMPQLEFNGIPSKKFQNSNANNEKKLAILPPELWITIFSSLTSSQWCTAMVVCKFFGQITNESPFREVLYEEKQKVTRWRLNRFRTPFPMQNSLEPPFSAMNFNDSSVLEQPGEQGYILKGRPFY